jgi:hypothetical protein
VPLDVDVGVDLGEPVLRDHLLDQHGDRVRQLVADAFEGRLPDQLGHQHVLGLVGEHVVRVELRRRRQVRHHHVGEHVELLAGHRADRHDLGELAQLATGAAAAASVPRSTSRSW